ncbi:hypothetical protein T4A_3442, partial [Trichinella pseudospiralis]
LHDDQTVKHKWTLVNADFVIRIDNGNMFDQLDLSQLFNNLMLDLELAVHVLSSMGGLVSRVDIHNASGNSNPLLCFVQHAAL